ncbi:hypothetical protein [Brachybacterium sp. J153]|uniref:hypothetical protein n=1 Tax=Brachybacterium sp. J153 TaxID=3116488 RepID=UPI002E78D935|nr:hypothetical protein [Brachybacterium sp. J153]MEE1618023.1 hypothetical protein [Brachybacterium sp. J153]
MSAQDDQAEWIRHRREVVEAKEQALRAARQDEHERATALIREAVAGYAAAGIDPIPLRARPFTGSGTLRTSLQGWYLKQDRSLAVDAAGNYYVMRVEGGLLARLRGADPEPSPAPLVVGRGARDGDTFELTELLRLRREDPVRP